MKRKKLEDYIPLDKYWVIRMGVLDMVYGYKDINIFLENRKNLSGDLLALKSATHSWNTRLPVDIGESGTLYRFLQFASLKLNLNKKFVKRGTLNNRKVCNDPKIVNWNLEKLLKLDGGTSQWASASILLGNKEKIKNEPYFIKVTREAQKHWKERRKNRKVWSPKYDEVLLRQAKYFLDIFGSKKSKFKPRNPDDYCFARVFNIIDKKYGEKNWPMLHGHESDRLLEMEKIIALAKSGKTINSKDHRVIQAIAMWGKVNKKEVKISHPEAVNKSWPQFWNFMENYKSFN